MRHVQTPVSVVKMVTVLEEYISIIKEQRFFVRFFLWTRGLNT
jgi:hypothetical protein